MTISELLKLDAVDEGGRRLGHVDDVRFTAEDGDPTGLVARGLVVGTLGFAERFGYARGVVEGPWIVARLLRWLARKGTFVPWDSIVEVRDGHVVVRRAGASGGRRTLEQR